MHEATPAATPRTTGRTLAAVPDWITLPKAVDPEPEEERLIREAIEEWLNSEDLP